MSFLEVPTLSHTLVRLEPLAPEHGPALARAIGDEEALWYTSAPTAASMAEEITARLTAQREGRLVPWTVVDAASGTPVGMTTYLNLEPEHGRLEIGNTWLGPAARGTLVNPAAKLLLLARAFGDLGCIAVEFRTHWHNRRSRAAIAKLGAKQDGVLRQHRRGPEGTLRDTVVFSILDSEWPTVRLGLEERLRAGAAPQR